MWFRTLLLPLFLLTGGGQAADRKSDYLQPYKFVKPLADLGDLYRQAEDAAAAAAEKDTTTAEANSKQKQSQPVAEDRVGLAAEKPLMTSDLAAPEPLPQPTALKENRSRSRKKATDSEQSTKEDRLLQEDMEEEDRADTKERKEAKEKKKAGEAAKAVSGAEAKEVKKKDAKMEEDEEEEEEGNMSNHNTEMLEGRALPPVPRPNAIKYRVPPKPEDEYYYYYDEYYEDYPDYLPYPGRPEKKKQAAAAVSQQQQPKSSERYPNFPAKPQSDKKRLPPPPPPSVVAAEKPPKEKSRKPSAGSGKPPKDLLPPPPPPPPSRKSEHGERKVGEPADISSTLNRLKSLKKKQQQQQQLQLPNPWEKFNAPPKQKHDHRKPAHGEEKRPNKPKVKPVRPYSDYYNEDYFYEYRPVHINRRQGVPAGGANPLALLVAPLAGIALMTAAAAVAISPVLLTVSLTGKRRRRRDADDMDEGISPQLEEKMHEIQVLEKFMSSIPDNMDYQHQVLSMYLSCSGYTALANRCLDRVVCEYADTGSKIAQEERDVISIVLFNVMSNEFVPEDFKERLKLAARTGRDNHTCLAFECDALVDLKSNDL